MKNTLIKEHCYCNYVVNNKLLTPKIEQQLDIKKS